ncbi:uncharacterized protein yc1106_01237 [Curvularia clavata]|uniref:Myb-like domain-containing protein n=1 Tax=Curvularia clavata TaxID=95742 RepID=A0A9Q8Z424_CURCL|nr:uncharacterized protein yc1106_01237 [Curvularia clavata]
MADRRRVRSESRRATATPQPPSKATATNPGRASRARSLRSASREIVDFGDFEKHTRRRTRQASITGVIDDSENEGKQARQTRRQAMKEPLEGLTVVEEMDTQIALDEIEILGTPQPASPEIPMPFRSPGAVSEMSGTTAISSFSMVEAEFLEPRFIVKHLRKLCDSAQEFLEHIAPSNATMHDDLLNIQEMQKPGSAYSEEYLDYEIELNVHLKHFKSEEHSYIHIRALHRALFGANEQIAATQTGLDLILYLANLLVFAKQMIHSDRDDKIMWDVLRQLDNTFPVQFMRSLQPDGRPFVTGESGLFKETFELALELRTQLAILVLQKSADSIGSDPDDILDEIFLRSESSQAVDGSPIRGWNTTALGGDESPLPQELEDHVAARFNKVREFFLTDEDSVQRGETVDLENLRAYFPWEPTILRLLAWVRLRRGELLAAIDELGGAAVIARNIKQLHEEPQTVIDQTNAPLAPQPSPRRKRTSFGRDRRRSSRKYDPNAAVDLSAIDVLKARERDSGVDFEVNLSRQEQGDGTFQQVVEEEEEEEEGEGVQGDKVQEVQTEKKNPTPQSEDDDLEQHDEQQAPKVEEQQGQVEEEEQQEQREEGDDVQPKGTVEEGEDQAEEPSTSNPPPSKQPTSSAEMLRRLKAVHRSQKENRPVSIFDRQANAERVEFGDGFDETQPTPGPSNTNKGKQPVESSSRKRSRPMDDEDESDAFESEDRGLRVPERRRKAPVAKKVRIEPASSGTPLSHQPHPWSSQPTQQTLEQEESVSETDAPEMTEEIPASTYQAQRQLALENQVLETTRYRNERKSRREWSPEEEDSFCEYMRMYPAKYATILKYDANNGNFLQGRSQVNLKDKARSMALNMIKSGTGLRPGFENIIHPREKHGMALMANGWMMQDDGEWVRQR